MAALLQLLKTAGRKATGWKTTAAGIALAGLGGYLLWTGQPEPGWGAIALGAGFVLGVDDTAAGGAGEVAGGGS